MRKFFAFTVALFLIVVVTNSFAQEIIPACKVQAVSEAVVKGMKKSELVSWVKYEAPFKGYQAVAVIKGKRYTVFVSNEDGKPDDSKSAFISIWERPDGTHSRKLLESWSDTTFDGTVDTSSGKKEGNFFQTRHNEVIEILFNFYYPKGK